MVKTCQNSFSHIQDSIWFAQEGGVLFKWSSSEDGKNFDEDVRK